MNVQMRVLYLIRPMRSGITKAIHLVMELRNGSMEAQRPKHQVPFAAAINRQVQGEQPKKPNSFTWFASLC